jgi:hypothetical protein
MAIQQKLYQATKDASLFDYSLFNNDKDEEKNDFLKKLNAAVIKSQWFNIADFSHLENRTFSRTLTQVAKVDEETKNHEIASLLKIFTEEELQELATIIENLKSYGVLSIKELMDNQDIANAPKSFIKRILLKLSFFK